MRFAPEYVTYVLNENFEDAKANFLSPLMALHYAHLVMLAEQGIVSRADAHAIRDALDSVCEDEVRKVVYDGTYEDLFFYLDRLIVDACGADVAGRLHTARSRNDIAMTTYRMRQRECLLDLLSATLDLRRSLLWLISQHHDTVFAVHTHTQRAQPTTVAHYLLAVAEQVERDAIRLKGAFERTNRNPLGACAITGTGFNIDRKLTSDLLGFAAPTVNTYGSIATIDYLLESASAAMVLVTGMGRFVQDLLLWSTAEFDYVRLGDGFVQGSSIMPQKRNPVALEHARVIGSKAVGQAQAVMTAVHNTPFGDINDTEAEFNRLEVRSKTGYPVDTEEANRVARHYTFSSKIGKLDEKYFGADALAYLKESYASDLADAPQELSFVAMVSHLVLTNSEEQANDFRSSGGLYGPNDAEITAQITEERVRQWNELGDLVKAPAKDDLASLNDANENLRVAYRGEKPEDRKGITTTITRGRVEHQGRRVDQEAVDAVRPMVRNYIRDNYHLYLTEGKLAASQPDLERQLADDIMTEQRKLDPDITEREYVLMRSPAFMWAIHEESQNLWHDVQRTRNQNNLLRPTR